MRLRLMVYFFLFQFSVYLSISGHLPGNIVAFAGLSGCGKSTMAQLLSVECAGECVLEPEEIDWPVTIQERGKYGFATGLLGFRQLWATQLVDADLKRKEGSLSLFIDVYFFKIYEYYLGKPGMEWLLSQRSLFKIFLKIYAFVINIIFRKWIW